MELLHLFLGIEPKQDGRDHKNVRIETISINFMIKVLFFMSFSVCVLLLRDLCHTNHPTL